MSERTLNKLSRWVVAGVLILGVGFIVVLWTITVRTSNDFSNVFGKYPVTVFAKNAFATYLIVLSCYVALGRSSWRRRAQNAVLNLIAVSAAGFVIEMPAVLGWVDYRVYFIPKTPGAEGPHNMRLETEFYYHRPPHDRFSTAPKGDTAEIMGLDTERRYPADYSYDRNGFRNDRDLEHAPIVLLGDSFVEGYKVRSENMLSTHLSKMLQVDVANLGQSGFGPVNELAVLRHVALPLRPSVIVWFFYEGNDLYDYEHEKAQWNRRDPKLRLFTLTTLRVAAWAMNASSRVRNYPSSVVRFGPQTDTMYFAGGGIPSTEKNLTYLKSFQTIVAEAKRLCDENGTQLLLTYIPAKARVYRKLTTLPNKIEAELSQSDIPGRLAQWGALQGISYLDLYPALSRAAPETLVYYLDDEHWSPEGHKIVAEDVSALIQQRKWLKTERQHTTPLN